jgi:hypothetical protein
MVKVIAPGMVANSGPSLFTSSNRMGIGKDS